MRMKSILLLNYSTFYATLTCYENFEFDPHSPLRLASRHGTRRNNEILSDMRVCTVLDFDFCSVKVLEFKIIKFVLELS